MKLSRRGALAASASVPLAACGSERGPGVGQSTQPEPSPAGAGANAQEVTVERIAYGEGPAQFAELYRPAGDSRGVVVVIHGGFWKAAYDLSLGQPLAQSLAERGWTAWNIEYRRVGNGGGTPATFDDVGAAIDALADVEGLALSVVVTLGHSAGGHLAVWAAGRSEPRVPITHAISQAGVLDLIASDREGLGGGAATALLGHVAGRADGAWDPQQQIPLGVPVWCVHGREDSIVPLSQSHHYVAAAQEAGAIAEVREVDGDHFVLIDPRSAAWQTQLDILDEIDA